jgi:serine/threonine-protein kinase
LKAGRTIRAWRVLTTSFGLALSLALLASRSASAQTDASPEARVMFEDARRLMRAGQYPAACAELESVRRLYAGSGVLLNLGDCYEKVGRTASAWAAFDEAGATAAAAKRRDYEAEATRRKAALEPRLSRLTVHVPESDRGVEVTRDSMSVSGGAAIAVPVDVGAHEVTARAGGRLVWSASVEITAPGETVTVEVPELRLPELRSPATDASGAAARSAIPQTAPATPKRHEPAVEPAQKTVRDTGSSSRRVAGVTMAGLGAVGVGASVALALVAESRFAVAEGESGMQRSRDSDGAASLGNGASLALAIGVSLLASGAVLWFSAANHSARVGTDGRGLLIGGSF